MKSLRIGLVLDDTLDSPDGVQQYVLLVGEWLASRGHDVYYLVGETSRTDRPGIHSLARNKKVRFNGNTMSVPLPVSLRRCRQTLDKLQLDVLHVQVPYSPHMAGRLIRLASAHTAIVGTFHILAYSKRELYANKFLKLLNAQTGRRFDKMMATSEPARLFASSVYGYEAEVVANPIDLQRFTRPIKPASKKPQIIFLGRLVARKGALYLLRAITSLRDRQLYNGDFSVVIGGKGKLYDELMSYIETHRLGDVVRLVGFVDEKDKVDFLAQADVAVFPSVSGESFGISLLEAFACANGPVIAGDNPGYRSVMSGLPNAEHQLVVPRQTEQFAHMLAMWLSDTKQRTQVAHTQHQYVRNFDIRQIGERIESIYNEALRLRRQS